MTLLATEIIEFAWLRCDANAEGAVAMHGHYAQLAFRSKKGFHIGQGWIRIHVVGYSSFGPQADDSESNFSSP